MKKEILVSVDQDEVRVAITEDQEMVEFYIERSASERLAGNVYLGKVENVLPGMEACFVDVGLERNAFLYVDDAYPVRSEEEDELPDDVRKATISKLVHRGQRVMVQIVKEPIGSKGARVTRAVTLPGRYLVLMPVVDYVGVSRRITDEKERSRLKQIAQSVRDPGTGLIVRTVAEGKGEKDLCEDYKFLVKQWREIEKKSKRAKAPALLYRDMGLSYRILRDCLDRNVTLLLVDDRQEYEKILGLLDVLAPTRKQVVKLYREKEDLFDRRGVNEEIEKAVSRRVWLDCGGYLVFDRTEALTSIDVNTGRYVGKADLQSTVVKTNLEAAEEIARQLRIRDIGGIIIIDFIDMDSPKNREKVVEVLENALSRDKTRATVLGITQLGLVEMTRKKVKESLGDILLKPCPYCEGSGQVVAEHTMSSKVRSAIRKALLQSSAEALLVEVHPSVAALVIGAGGSNLKKLEEQTGRSVYVRGAESCHPEEMKIVAMGDREDVERQALPVKEGDVLELKIEEPHISNAKDGIARVEGYVIDVEEGGRFVGDTARVEIIKAYRTYARARLL
ncbi:MAG: Rne/Rng family ribonuclease [Bacillota bacterium]